MQENTPPELNTEQPKTEATTAPVDSVPKSNENPENTSGKPESIAIRNEKGQLQKGSNLNPAGKPKGARHLTTRLLEAIDKVAEGELEPTDVVIIKRVTQMARRGDLAAISMIWGRLEGSTPQTIVHEGNIGTLTQEQLAKLDSALGIKLEPETPEQSSKEEAPKVAEQPTVSA